MNESPGTLELLSIRVDELEKRVHALEHPDESRSPAAKPVIALASEAPVGELGSLQTANIFPILGRAMLGIAGAYVLRAVAEAGLMPRVVVAAVAIAYAFAWLVWAARASRVSGFAPLIYAGTSTLILAPMLWEITLHFRVFSPMVTAGILTGFAALATAIGLKEGASRFAWIPQSVAAIIALALALATHDLAPFAFGLLLAFTVVEYTRVRSNAQPVWPLIALVTDGAVWGMIFIYSGPQNARVEYPELGVATLVLPACLLFAINATTVTGRAILQEHKITVFEIVQVMIAFGLAISSVLFFAPNAVLILGIACLVLSAAAYTASFRYLGRCAAKRNFRVFSLWSAALLVAGLLWALPQPGAGIALAVAGLAAYIADARMNSNILELHGAVFLSTAAVVSGAALYIFGALAGSLPAGHSMTVWIVACAAVLAYAAGTDKSDAGWSRQMLHLVPALLAASMLSALIVRGAVTFTNLALPQDAHHVAFLRTLVISAMALCLAFAGSRWGRIAMTRLAYVALAFVAAKLLFEDLRHGHMEFIAGSIFLFALTLIAVPRLVRLGTKLRTASRSETPVHIPS